MHPNCPPALRRLLPAATTRSPSPQPAGLRWLYHSDTLSRSLSFPSSFPPSLHDSAGYAAEAAAASPSAPPKSGGAGRRGGEAWWRVAGDGYFHDYAAHHLEEALSQHPLVVCSARGGRCSVDVHVWVVAQRWLGVLTITTLRSPRRQLHTSPPPPTVSPQARGAAGAAEAGSLLLAVPWIAARLQSSAAGVASVLADMRAGGGVGKGEVRSQTPTDFRQQMHCSCACTHFEPALCYIVATQDGCIYVCARARARKQKTQSPGAATLL